MRAYRWLHVLNVALFVGLWVFTLIFYERLPEQVPGHIGPSGVTRWEARETGTWFIMPVLMLTPVLVVYALAFSARDNAALFNMPHKKRILALPREGQRYVMASLQPVFFGMVTWLLLLGLQLQIQMYRVAWAAQESDATLGSYLAGTLALAFAPLLGLPFLSRMIRQRIEEWETRAE